MWKKILINHRSLKGVNRMCDRYSYKYGYICDECFEELLLVVKI